jgi:hypothetical protein
MPFELLRAIRRSLNFMPFFRIFGSKIVVKNAGKSLRWSSNVLIFCVLIYRRYISDNSSIFWTSMTTWTSKILHFWNCTCVELLEQFEGSRTLTNFIEPCSQYIKLNNPGTYILGTHTSWASQFLQVRQIKQLAKLIFRNGTRASHLNNNYCHIIIGNDSPAHTGLATMPTMMT